MSTSPTSDSLKMPIVLMAIDRPGLFEKPHGLSLLNGFFANVSENYQKSLLQYLAPVVGFNRTTVPMWEFLQDFTFERGTQQHSTATFTLFDPEFYTLLSYFTQIRADPMGWSLYFRWGWFDNGEFQLTPFMEFQVLEITPKFLTDGVMLTIKAAQAFVSSSKGGGLTGNKGFTVHFPKTYNTTADPTVKPVSGDMIVKAIIETDWDAEANARALPDQFIHINGARLMATSAVKEIQGGKQRPRCITKVKCKPLQSMSQGPLVMPADTTPMAWLRQVIIPNLRPLDDADGSVNTEDTIVLIETPEKGVFTLTTAKKENLESVVRPGTYAHKTVNPYRVFHFGRSIRGNVLAFEIQDTQAIANTLGGGGADYAINPRLKKGQGVQHASTPNLTLWDGNDPETMKKLAAANAQDIWDETIGIFQDERRAQREHDNFRVAEPTSQVALAEIEAKKSVPQAATTLRNDIIKYVNTPREKLLTDEQRVFYIRTNRVLTSDTLPTRVRRTIPKDILDNVATASTKPYTKKATTVLYGDDNYYKEQQDLRVLIDLLADEFARENEAVKAKAQAIRKAALEAAAEKAAAIKGHPIGHVGRSVAQSFDNLSFKRLNAYGSALNAATQARAAIIGDPTLKLLDFVVFNMYSGGTITTAGRYADSNDPTGMNQLTLIPFVSGLYNVLEIRDIIRGGAYTQELTLNRVVALGNDLPNANQIRTEESPLLGNANADNPDTAPGTLDQQEFFKLGGVQERIPGT